MKPNFNWRTSLAFLHDVLAAAVAWGALWWTRFSFDLPAPFADDMLQSMAWVVPMQAAIFLAFGLYRGLWRFASMVDLKRIFLAASLGALLVPFALVLLKMQALVPRSVIVLYPVVLIFLMAGDRFAYRMWKEHRLYSPLAALGEPVLVAGAGRGRRAAHQGAGAQPPMARRRPARRRRRQARPPAAQGCACWVRSPSCRRGCDAMACAR